MNQHWRNEQRYSFNVNTETCIYGYVWTKLRWNVFFMRLEDQCLNMIHFLIAMEFGKRFEARRDKINKKATKY